jgi:putative drug exporter of the RND superfamily
MVVDLSRLGSWCATHPWRVLAAWIGVLALALGVAVTIGAAPRGDVNDPGAPADARVVVHRPSASLNPAELQALRGRLQDIAEVSRVSPPRISGDGATALIAVHYRLPVTAFAGPQGRDALERAVSPIRADGTAVEIGGEVPENYTPDGPTAEKVAVLLALALLFLLLGSVSAIVGYLLVAIFGIGTGLVLVVVLAGLGPTATIAPYVAALVGIALSADYVLHFLHRFRQEFRTDGAARTAAVRAGVGAARHIVIAGGAVVASLVGLQFLPLPMVSTIALAVGGVVVCLVATAVTIMPAVGALAGHRLCGRWLRKGRTDEPAPRRNPVADHPVATVMVTVLVLALLSAPVLDLRTWPRSAGSWSTADTIRRAHDLVATEFGPGANGPITVVLDAGMPAAAVVATLRATDAFAYVSDPEVDDAHPGEIVTVEARTAPPDAATVDALGDLRAAVPEGARIVGATPYFADAAARLEHRLWPAILGMVALAGVAMAVAFRDPVAAVLAAAAKLLGLTATYGILVAVVQWGWGASLLDLPAAVPMSTWAVALAVVMILASATTYEAFTAADRSAIRVVLPGAVFATVILLAFAIDPDIVVRMLCVATAIGLIVDVVFVRLLLIPAATAWRQRRGQLLTSVY